MVRRMNGCSNGRTNRWTNGWTIFLSYTDAIEASENDDFLTALAFLSKALPSDQPMDQRTNRPTNGWTYPIIEMR